VFFDDREFNPFIGGGQINTSIGYVYVTQEDNLLPWRTAAGRSLAGVGGGIFRPSFGGARR
jgi:hypothetical protein